MGAVRPPAAATRSAGASSISIPRRDDRRRDGGCTGQTGPVTDWVLHVDLDQFIAAVEVLRRPELRGLPVVVGGDGDPTKRGVVATASYEARVFGVHSGLPMRTAAAPLPGCRLPARRPGRLRGRIGAVMAALRSLGAVTEVMGWDEAFLAVRYSPTRRASPGSSRSGSGPPRSSTAPSASARTSCRPSWPPTSASRPACSG